MSNKSASAIAIIEMARGYQLSQAIHVAAQLGIADLLADGPRPGDDIARATQTHPQAMHRLLRVLASRGVLAESRENGFGLTPAGRLLRRDTVGSVRDQVLYWGHPMHWGPWGELMHSLRTGEPAFERTHGLPFYDYVATSPEASQVVRAAAAAQPSLRDVPVVIDFSNCGLIVDVGGGRGDLLVEVLRQSPEAQAILFDAPGRTAGAGAALAYAGVEPRCRVVEGDLVADLPQEADAYLLANLLMDWDDPTALPLLRACRDAMSRAGMLIIVELLIPANNAPSLSQLGDLTGLAITGGRIRSEREFDRLFAAAGLSRRRTIMTRTGHSILEVRRAT